MVHDMNRYNVDTENSTYQIEDRDGVTWVRRLAGRADPTPRQGPDGEWKHLAIPIPFEDILLDVPLIFVWNILEDGTMQSTMTSNVVGVERAWVTDDEVAG
jgi:hypothetical protein